MVILITSQASNIDSPIMERFGRAPWFIKVDTETGASVSLENPAAAQSGGAGIAAAQFAVDNKVNCVISGDFGPNAARVLEAASIDMYIFDQTVRTVRQTVEFFQQGKLLPFKNQSV